MDILFVASEVAPYSKTGGLGDVAGALPRALAARGHDVAVVTPRYGSIDPVRHRLEPVGDTVWAGTDSATLWRSSGRPPVYFLENERHYGSRRGLYNEHGHDYRDNAQRFAFLSRVALALPAVVGLAPRIVHLNDWQTSLAAWMIRHEPLADPRLARARTVLTIHNLAYQGVFPKQVVPALGLPWEVFRYEAMEFYDQLNFLKAGIVYSDALTTVSPTYAKEILTPEHGWGLDALLRHRSPDLHGILNGIDTAVWDPSRDPHLPGHFERRALAGKGLCKAALQREMGVPVRADVPLIAMIGRLAEQKGIDLVVPVLGDLLARDVQLVVLGSGRHDYEHAFERAARAYPQKMAARIGFDESLAHRIEAGADIFLMPSRFEPCGLNQMYSLRYGTVPVVRAVGGLEDTVVDYDGFRSGTGFKFRDYHPQAMLTALRRALDVFRDERAWIGIVDRGMAEDFSWDASAQRYEALYRELAG